MKNKFLISALVLSIGIPIAPAIAGVITSATSVVSAPPTTGSFSFDRTIDQSGLSAGYVSGTTDFATYVAGDPRHIASNGPENYAASFSVPPAAVVDYDLGSSLGITQLALWQYPFASSGPILDFEVYTSNDALFGSSTLVGGFTALIDGTGLGGVGNAVQVFDLADTTARYLRINVLTIDGSVGFGWSEIAFDTGPVGEVPEPAMLGFLGLGLVGLGITRRRRFRN